MHKHPWENNADTFISNESAFHLGFLVTESSHPCTKTLSQTIKANTGQGISQLLLVDTDIGKAFPNVVKDPGMDVLQHAITASVNLGNRIIFSGCGSTGRLSILLESMWKKGCIREAERLELEGENLLTTGLLNKSANNVRGIITGGDRALIKSVESFEDYQEIGRQQVRELNLNPGDIFIAISEGGETSSVIGTAWEAICSGCKTFFIFNNPKTLLKEKIERSKKLIDNPKVISIDLSTGPMAIAGSTRMQATTMELLAIGSVLESSLIQIITDSGATVNSSLQSMEDYTYSFNNLLKSLQRNQSIKSLAAIVELEEQVYKKKEMLLYTINDFLLDIFTDTTERTPTFSTPPLKSTASPEDPFPWAAALDPNMKTKETWLKMIGREPIGLNWDSSLYDKLSIPELAKKTPTLDREEIYSYKIGSEGFSQYSNEASTLIRIVLLDSKNREYLSELHDNSVESMSGFKKNKYQLVISDSDIEISNANSFLLKLNIPETPLRLFSHIAAKLVFNTISTATMARLGRIKGNWMIEVTPSNKKLIDRSIRIISDLKSISYKESAYLIFKEIYNNPQNLSSLVTRLL